MAGYKQPCIHCNSFISRDVRYCPVCNSSSPFGYSCPACLAFIQKDSRFAANVAERFMLTVSNAVNPPLSRKSVSIAERA